MKSIEKLIDDIDLLVTDIENLCPEIEDEEDERLWEKTIRISSKMSDLKYDFEDLNWDVTRRYSRMDALEKDFKSFLLGPRITLGDIEAEIFATVAFVGIALMLVLMFVDIDYGLGEFLAYFAGVFAASIGVYSYHRGMKEWQQEQYKAYFKKYGKE